MRSKLALTSVLMLFTFLSFAQGKYFEVVIKKAEFTGGYFGTVQPLNNQYSVNLDYKGKSKKALMRAIMNYVKARPVLRLTHVDSIGDGIFVMYRDFSTVGSAEKCLATMVARSFISAVPEEGMVLVNLGYGLNTKIYSSLFDAKLSISVDDIVVADDNVPFNEYQIVQPADQGVLTSSVWFGTREKKQKLKSAYPESIFDPKGKLINPDNKKILEDFYDFYITDLKNYLDKNVK